MHRHPAARNAARALGGWGAATGLIRPRWRDLPQALGWMIVFKFMVGVVLAVLIAAGLRQSGAGNTAGLRHASVAAIALTLPSAVLVAPVFEELLFRGLLLRALTTRYGFTLALVVSSAVFGAGHVRSLDSQGIGLFAGTALFGAALGLLARHRGTLTLGIAVHALSNLASITLVLTLQ